MTFQPILPVGGLQGWVLLNNTLERQTEVFNRSPALVRQTDYFEQNIANVRTPDDLVSDRRLLEVALGAFGLGDDINSQALIKRVLEGSTSDRDALVNRLTDERYAKLSDAFGFGETGLPRTALQGFGREIVERYRRMEFEEAVGFQDQSLRLALNAEREISEVLSANSTEDGRWFTIMGNPPLRRVFETALGVPTSFGQLDIDRQLEIFQDRARDQLGIDTLSDLQSEEATEDFIRRYLLRDQVSAFQVQSSSSVALTLLQSAPSLFQRLG